MSYISIQNVNKTLGKSLILNDVSLDINKGEVISIIGDSGNGKTTFLRCVCGLYSLDTGSILVDDIDLSQVSSKDYYSNVGLVFQNYNLFNQYTALENVKLALDFEVQELKKQVKLSRQEVKEKLNENIETSKELLTLVGLKDKLNMYPHQLSGGQAQRVAIARVLAKKPKLLCFDEPTSALDPKSKLLIEKLIKTLKDAGQTTLIVSHDLDFVSNVSDKVYYMSKGVFVESGTPSEFFNNPKTDKLKDFLNTYSKEKENEKI